MVMAGVTQYSDSGLDAGIPQLHKLWPADDITLCLGGSDARAELINDSMMVRARVTRAERARVG